MSKSSFISTIQVRKPKQNVFDLSHEKKLSIQFGKLYPILLQEVIPGDKFRVNTEMLIRLAPMMAPVMHRMNAYVHYFFVPNRLVYDEWQNFITGGESGTEAPAFPVINITNANGQLFVRGSLADYFGVPPVTDQGIQAHQNLSINALPFRAYQLIWNEYYRDQNLQSPAALTKNGTVDAAEDDVITTMRYRCWEKDYFTSMMPTSQRGAEVELPFSASFTPDYKDVSLVKHQDGTNTGAHPGEQMLGEGGELELGGTALGRIENLVDPQISDSASITVNDLRQATKIQVWLEKMMRGGSRYIEQILMMFGIIDQDARLQRPEYLGGGKTPIVVSEVLSTAETTTANVGEMAGHGIGVGNTNQFKRSFTEHGFIIGILSVLPRTCYFQGFEKHWFKTDKFQYAWPDLATLGEEEVKFYELFHKWDDADPDTDPTTGIGYQPRFSDYRFKNSSVHGDFRTSLLYWTLAREFDGTVTLNEDLVSSEDASKRIFNVADRTVDNIYVQLYNSVQAIRSLPVYGTPSL